MTIADFLSSTGITCLYHFTDERNLPLIREHGILPYTDLLSRGIVPPKPGGNDWSRDADAVRGVDRFVHLCLKDQHPMEYLARQNGHVGQTRFLRISTDVLHFPDVMGCSGVANKSGVSILPLEHALDAIDLAILFQGHVDFSNEALKKRYNEAKKAEILIPARIPQELIHNLH
jgi:hypothetical protein